MPKQSTALQELIELRMQRDRERTPLYPDAYRIKPKYDTATANGLTKAIIDYIDLKGGWATRISVEGRMIKTSTRSSGVFGSNKTDQYKRIPSSVKRGTADIHAVYLGRHISIEVKIGADRQSDEQKEIEQLINDAGGHYFIARTFEAFHEFINTIQPCD